MADGPGVVKARPWPAAAAVAWMRRYVSAFERVPYARDALCGLVVRGYCLTEQLLRLGLREAINATPDELDVAVRLIRAEPTPTGAACPHCGGALPPSEP